MALFEDRQDAGQLLAKALSSYRGKEVIVLGLPRGGVVTAAEIASSLSAPLNLAFAHKIGHPHNEEYAIAAISESGHLVGNPRELTSIDKVWFERRKKEVLEEIQHRRNTYLGGQSKPDVTDKIVILVDDGIATGLTMQAAIVEIKNLKPKKLIVSVPIAPEATADLIRSQIDEFIAVRVDPDDRFLGGVGAYYEKFQQVTDREVIDIMRQQIGDVS